MTSCFALNRGKMASAAVKKTEAGLMQHAAPQIDKPDVMTFKQHRLQKAGAAVHPPKAGAAVTPQQAPSKHSLKASSYAAVHAGWCTTEKFPPESFSCAAVHASRCTVKHFPPFLPKASAVLQCMQVHNSTQHVQHATSSADTRCTHESNDGRLYFADQYLQAASWAELHLLFAQQTLSSDVADKLAL